MTNAQSVTGMSHLSVSEVVTGLILCGKQTPTSFNPEFFSNQFSSIIKDYKNGKTIEELYGKYGNLIQQAQHAAKSVNGLGEELDWAELINKKYRTELIKQDSAKLSRYLDSGEDEKARELLSRMSATLTSSQRLRSVLASEIDTENYSPFTPSGSKAWDKHIGGFPNVGMVVLGAKTYVGKTTVAIFAMANYLKQYPDREIMFVTLEDMNEGWKARAKVILGDKNEDFWKRIHVMEFASDVDTIIAEASRFPKVTAIFLDYIDYLASETSLQSYVDIYRKMSTGAKSLAVGNEYRALTVFMLAQFGKTLYKGGVPTPAALPFAGDQFAYQICLLYHADGDWYADNEENSYTLPAQPGKGYLVFWKVKNARPHDDEFPGAIKVNWSAKFGFDLDDDGEWVSLASETKRTVNTNKRR